VSFFDVWHVGCIVRLGCIIRERAISRLDNARCALSRLVNALSQACESAFTEKNCTLHGLKGAWHRAVIDIKLHNDIVENVE